jgi:endo-1,4-beta-D-glucanase Y
MHEAGVSIRPPLRIVDDLHGTVLVAALYWSETVGYALLRLNRAILAGDDFDHVLSWARRELAQGKPGSLLLADELEDLA